MAHGCASSAWTIGFYALHNWMLALFDELAQEGGLCDASVPRARSAGADGPGRPDGRRRPADRPVVVGHRGDARQLDHRRRAVRT
jgi:3-hydroxy-9,10-secoandrosta-1,3,5(10)-triene-9,17-dione monooxygenase